ncbi:MAG: APC family permease [Pyrinomonadaceae bacterium]|nr:APC family permease [Pyrinomonadaceae bacterium]
MHLVTASPAPINRAQPQRARLPRHKRLNFLALVSVIFFTVSGGAYGLEPLVGAVGAGWAVGLVIVTPILWSLPIALMVAELSSAMPEEGGYYAWVRNSLGNFWSVQEGWWTICYTAVDMAIYPVLFVNYFAYFYPQLALDETGSASWPVMLTRWLIAVLLIAVALAINWRGASAVGRSATINVSLVLVPFALLAISGLAREGGAQAAVAAIKHDLANTKEFGLLALGLSTVMWNYMGWDNVSTFADEVDDATRNYPRALFAALPITIAAYLLPLLAGIAVTTDPAVWNESAGWPVLAQLIGGKWLGVVVASAALISAWSLFNSQLLYVSRLPFVMARDGWLPSPLARVSAETGVPTTALIASCVVSALFAALPFGKLVIIDVLLYAAALSLEFAALIWLRLKRPEMKRPFRVPGGWPSITLITLAPMCFAAVVLWASFSDASTDARQAMMVIAVMASGFALYFARKRRIHDDNRSAVSE